MSKLPNISSEKIKVVSFGLNLSCFVSYYDICQIKDVKLQNYKGGCDINLLAFARKQVCYRSCFPKDVAFHP